MRKLISGLFLLLGLAGALCGAAALYTHSDAPVRAEVNSERQALPPQEDRDSMPSPKANASEPIFNTASTGSVSQDTKTSFQERLYQVPVAYEAPKTVAFGRSFNVTFAIDGTGGESAANALPGKDDNIVEDTAKISDRLKALLVGSDFEIELLSPETQRLSLLTENVWRWRVTPQSEGEHALTLELYALDGDEAVPVRTFSDEVIVSVSTLQRVLGAADNANPLMVLLGGIGSAIGGFFGFFRFFRKQR